jgi:hypothetical protein
MTAISVYDLTDDVLDDLAARGIVRLAPPIDLTPEPEPTFWYPGKPRQRKPQATRRCTGCGIDTTLPDLCADCTASGWFA